MLKTYCSACWFGYGRMDLEVLVVLESDSLLSDRTMAFDLLMLFILIIEVFKRKPNSSTTHTQKKTTPPNPLSKIVGIISFL